ncbi:MAG: PIN domain-containing protein [Planctomycetota bacterium]|jgi:predicted nucleic acid-binding protein
MRLLLDTNAYVAVARGHPEVAALVRRAERLLFSVVVLGELLSGFRAGSRERRNRQELLEFLDSPWVELAPVTEVTADRYGRVVAQLKEKGTPIPTNDAWLAAQALETGADLLTFNRHFETVEGLALALP